jgi:large subunit ribosomal protein L21
MFAVIKTGGKQYRVAADDRLRVARLSGDPGQIVPLGHVMMVGGDTPQLGDPVAGATVGAEIIAHERGDKVISFKKRRRKNSRRKRGYRDEYTLVRITEILTDGKTLSQTAKPKPERKPKAEPAAAAADDDEDTGSEKPGTKAKAKAKAKAKTPAKKPAAKPAAKGKSKKK